MRAYREEGFPVTIVRPSLTDGETQIPLAVNSWAKSYTMDQWYRLTAEAAGVEPSLVHIAGDFIDTTANHRMGLMMTPHAARSTVRPMHGGIS